LTNFAECFSRVPVVGAEVRALLLDQPDVRESEAARQMIKFGVTPLTILTATDAVSGLADRMISRGYLKPEVPLFLSVEDAEDLGMDHQRFEFIPACAEIERAAQCSASVASAVLRWCVGVAQYKPLLFNEFESKPATHFGITMKYTGADEPDLMRRWAETGFLPPPVPSDSAEKHTERVDTRA
jgi:hypothetical protein